MSASPWPALAVAALLVLPALLRRSLRGWAIAFAAALALCLGLQSLPNLLGGERVLGDHWNWSGALLSLSGALWLAWLLARRAGLPWREMGFTLAQRAGSLRPALWVSAAALSLNLLAANPGGLRLARVPLETWLYQASMPGLVEEVLFRGLLLALLDRAFTARRIVFGAAIGWGAVVVTVVFVALHGFGVFSWLVSLPAALLYLWLRVHTGSLLLPVVVHNLWNLSVYAAHL